LRAVVDNLLENAVHHTESEPTVEVSVTRDGEAVHLSVADDGPGIRRRRSTSSLARPTSRS